MILSDLAALYDVPAVLATGEDFVIGQLNTEGLTLIAQHFGFNIENKGGNHV